MMRLLRALFVLLAVIAAPSYVCAQGTVLQSGPWTPGNFPAYVGQGSEQPVIQDSGVNFANLPTGICASGLTPGTYGGAANLPTITVNAAGCVTGIGTFPSSTIVGICPVFGSPGTYGDATDIPVITLNGNGCVTIATTAPLPFAANSDVWAGTSHKIIDTAVALSSISPVSLSLSGATFTPDFTAAINMDMLLVHATCPCTIANPVSAHAGTSGFLQITQSATGSDTVTWGASWKFPGGTAPTLSTGASAVDQLPYYCHASNFCTVSFIGNVH